MSIVAGDVDSYLMTMFIVACAVGFPYLITLSIVGCEGDSPTLLLYLL